MRNIKDKEESSSGSEITVDVTQTEYPIVVQVMRDTLGYKLNNSQNNDWDLCWIDLGINPEIVSKMKPYQKINHFPNTWCLSDKDQLGINLSRMYRAFRNEYEFFPQTWVLPGDWNCMKADINKSQHNSFIIKPEGLSQGKGIYLTKGIDNLNPNDHCVVQRYLENPYLIDGLKFDLRMYILVYGCDPLRVYVFKEGLTRLSTEKYVKPDSSNLQNQYIHLTNYAINKFSKNFIYNSDANNTTVGHKRSLVFIWDHIDKNGGNSTVLRANINDIIIKTLCAVQPKLKQCFRSCQPTNLNNNMCFEILGIDILIDEDLKPWLLEINHAPSFNIDTPFDYKLKSELLTDAIKLLHLDSANRIKYQGGSNDKAIFDCLSEKEKELLRQNAMIERDKYEMQHYGGFTRIYPDDKLNAKYQAFIDYAEYELNQHNVVKPKIESIVTLPLIKSCYSTSKVKLPSMKVYKSLTSRQKVKQSKRKEPTPFLQVVNGQTEKSEHVNETLHESKNSRLVFTKRTYYPKLKAKTNRYKVNYQTSKYNLEALKALIAKLDNRKE